MKKIAEVHPYCNPAMAVYYDSKRTKKSGNRYAVYKEWTESFYDTGLRAVRSVQHKRLVAQYGNFYSCMAVMAEYIRDNDEEKRGDS